MHDVQIIDINQYIFSFNSMDPISTPSSLSTTTCSPPANAPEIEAVKTKNNQIFEILIFFF